MRLKLEGKPVKMDGNAGDEVRGFSVKLADALRARLIALCAPSGTPLSAKIREYIIRGLEEDEKKGKGA